jgi:hypothetical protein
VSLPFRLAAVPVVIAAVAAGVWLTGAVLTEDATTAMVLTGLWFGLAGAVALFVGWRWRPLAVPVVAAYLVTATALGGYLLFTSTVDKVVNEDVVAAPPRATATGSSSSASPSSAPTVPVEIASGRFMTQAHETSGLASLIEQPTGDRVVTLTRFKTDPGPDLRVYLVPDPEGSVKNAVDLGRLKGNKGNQQFDVPGDAEAGAVVIWCRAFTVAFGTATLR